MRRWVILSVFLFGLAVAGCVDLKGVSSFSASSAHTLVTSNGRSYGYADYCADSCYLFNDKGRELKDLVCDCTGPKKYDSALQQEFAVLSGYFAALAKLSGVGGKIDAGPLGNTVVAGKYGRFSITGAEAGVASALSTAVTDVLTVHYKSKHLTEILQKYGPDVDKYIGILALHLDNLKNEVRVLETQLQVRTVLYMHAATTDVERWTLFSVYKDKKDVLDRVVAEYENKEQLIGKIREGHQQLLDNVSQLRSKGLKQRLISLAAGISYLSGK